MADDEEFLSEELGEDTMLRDAINALRLGNRAQARDLLTRLLKANQKNPTYWVWLSAVVETQKERIYCLQTALQADPQNAAARRGLILLGGLPPDDSVPPFPINRPRQWMEKLSIPHEEQQREGGWANPVVRLFIILGIAVVVIGVIIGGSLLFSNKAAPVLSTATHRPTFTLTFTPTVSPAFRTATPTFLGPTPLWMFLASTYTPTPLYVVTQHSIMTRASFEAGLRSLAFGNFETARIQFQDVLKGEPDAADVYYYLGESYRMQGNYNKARDAYQEAINRDSAFAPAFLGRARANLGLNPDEDILDDLDQAISLDPNYAEAYIARGAYRVDGNPLVAKKDLQAALKITPDSALAYLHLADAQLNLGENDAALVSAIHANTLDMTLVPVYLALARAYLATGQTSEAVSVLKTYTIFMPEDASAFLQLGIANNAAGEYAAALEVLNKAIDADRRNAEAYFQRGLSFLNLDNPSLAETDFKTALTYDPSDFGSQLGLARAYFMQDKPGDAYIQAEQKALPLAKSDITKAQCYYWEALFLEDIPDKKSADAYWNRLIRLPENALSQEWRYSAFEYLHITPTFTPTLSPTRTLTGTPTLLSTRTLAATLTPSTTRTLTKAPTLVSTKTLTKTPTSSPTKTLAATPTPSPTTPPTKTPSRTP
jgi:tetratricopeptide (TPR) repeat protein